MKDLRVQTARNPSDFRCLARAMQRNSVRQHEFATFLLLLSSRFDTGSTQHRTLRLASRTARCKETKLRQMLVNLGRSVRERRQRTLRFLFCFKLTKSAPIPLTILLLTLITAKPVRGRLLHPFGLWKSSQHVNSWIHSPAAPARRRSWHYLT